MYKKTVLIGLATIVLISAIVYCFNRYLSPVDVLDEMEDIRNSPSGEANNALQSHYAYLDTLEALNSSGALKDAVSYLDILIMKKTSFEPVYHLEKGKLLFSLSDFTSAIEAFSLSISTSPYDSKTALEWRAYAHLNLLDCESAMSDGRALISKDSSDISKYQRIKEACDSVSSMLVNGIQK